VFGATCHMSLSHQVTHVVAAKVFREDCFAYEFFTNTDQRGTVKVDAARRQGGIHIVWLAWFLDSLALWRRQDEQPYLIDADPATTTGTPRQTLQAADEAVENEDDGELITPDADMWADANAEVDAALEETDDEDEGAGFLAEDDEGDSGWRTDGSGMRYVLAWGRSGCGMMNAMCLTAPGARGRPPGRQLDARNAHGVLARQTGKGRRISRRMMMRSRRLPSERNCLRLDGGRLA
jgi:hypothetical protein